MIAGSGQHHAAIGHHRLGQHAGAIFVGELPFKRLNVIELDHAAQQILGKPGFIS